MTRGVGVGRAALIALAIGILGSCKKQDDTPPPGYNPYGGYAPNSGGYYPNNGGYYPPPQPAPAAPAPAAHGGTPAMGFPCASDGDLQCPYGRCVNGRCGGCADGSWCKAGSGCAATPVGLTCWPGYANNVPPSQPNVPPPQPTFVPPAIPPSQPPAGNDAFAQARQTCVDRINAYRARVGAAPVSRDPSQEPCADGESRDDARSNRAHGTFGRCGERAQNACPNYPGRSTEEVLSKCLQQMFDEGPGGGHYDNMTNPKYTRAFCGFEAMGGGRIWTVQNFR
ncbi:MAG: hypothetical protein JST00_31955 [Deltaproteobacteria bacterium]|nr:hypothetical protein [Deltaproteobacteria bacterium]